MASRLEQLADDLWGAVDWYLDNAGENKEENIRLFRRQIDHYREALVIPGLHQIGVRLRKVAVDTMTPQFMSGPMANIGDQIITSSGLHWIGAYADVILELARTGVMDLQGKKAIKCHGDLLDSLHHYGEDVGAVGALMLALPPFIQPLTKNHLREAYKHAQGTGFKIAITYALLAHDDIELFEKFASCYLARRDLLETVITQYKKEHPHENLQEIRLEVYQATANPSTVELVCFDIATNGLGPRHRFADWVRKSE